MRKDGQTDEHTVGPTDFRRRSAGLRKHLEGMQNEKDAFGYFSCGILNYSKRIGREKLNSNASASSQNTTSIWRQL